MCHVTSHASCLGERDDRCHTWQASVFLQAQATQSPLCRRLAAVQRSRRLAEVGWQVMVQAFNWHGNASLPQMCRLQMRLQANADPQESRDPPADADRLFTKTRGRGLPADPLQHLPMDSQTRMRIFGQNPRTDVDEIFGHPHHSVVPGWARVNGIYNFTIARHQTLRSHAHDCLAYINQATQIFIAPYAQADQTLVIVHTDHPPPAYRMPQLPVVNLIIG